MDPCQIRQERQLVFVFAVEHHAAAGGAVLQHRELSAGFVGDFLAIATTEKTLFTAREEHEFVGVHAGLTEEEMTVPFIAIETEKRKRR